MSIDAAVAGPIADALGWALVHFVWQGAAVAAAYGLAGAALRGRGATARYAAACAALVAMFACFAGTAAYLATGSPAPPAPETPVAAAAPAGPTASGAAGADAPAEPLLARADAWARGALEGALPWLLAVWLAGVAALTARFVGGWAMAWRLTRVHVAPVPPEWAEALSRMCADLRVSRPVRMCESAVAEAPAVIGWLRPVILVPASAFTGLTPRQIEAVLAHELAHVRRHDYLVNLLQTAVETLLFYHPAVWWVSGRIREEREHCCDDVAVAACGDVLLYARALADLETLRPAAPRLAVAASGGSLLRRIERLLAPSGAHRGSPALSAVVALALVAALWLGAGTRLSARAEIFEVFAEGPQTTPSRTRTVRAARARAAHETELAQSAARPEPGAPPGDALAPSSQDETADDTAEDAAAEPEEDAAGRDEPDADAGDFIDELAASGYRGLTVDQLVALHTQGVTGRYIRDLRAVGLTGLSVDDLVAMRIQGVTADYAREMRAHGYGKTASSLVSLRIQGVTGALLKGLADSGYRGLTEDQVLAMRIQGVTPDYVRELAAAGYRGVPADVLLSARIQGVSAAYARELAAAGYEGLSLDRLIEMRIQGVTGAYAREIKALGFSPTAGELVEMRIQGVSPEFVRRLVGRGIKGLTVRELIRLRLAGFGE